MTFVWFYTLLLGSSTLLLLYVFVSYLEKEKMRKKKLLEVVDELEFVKAHKEFIKAHKTAEDFYHPEYGWLVRKGVITKTGQILLSELKKDRSNEETTQ